MKILLVEDSVEAAESLKLALKKFYVVEIAKNGAEGEYMANANNYDAFLVDYMLPDINGIELSKKLRESGIKVPIIMLTGNVEVKNKVDAFNTGADDYVTKPFSVDELRARIEAVTRRFNSTHTSSKLRVDDLILDTNTKTVQRGGKDIDIRKKELDLLEYLMKNEGKVLSRQRIMDSLWDSSHEAMTNLVDVHIKYLRDKIDRGFEKKLIKTVRGYGYKIQS